MNPEEVRVVFNANSYSIHSVHADSLLANRELQKQLAFGVDNFKVITLLEAINWISFYKKFNGE